MANNPFREMASTKVKPIIGFTMGDPSGIGPEIILRAVSSPIFKDINPVLIGDFDYFQKIKAFLIRKFHTRIRSLKRCPANTPISPDEIGWGGVAVLDMNNIQGNIPLFGKVTKQGGKASGEYIIKAVELALKGEIDGIVTAPINKEAFFLGGWGKKYPGHTEMVADLTHTKTFALMMIVNNLRAIHVTSHIPLKSVSKHITKIKILETIRLADIGLKQMGLSHPKIAVCGLNPHAGENGLMGKEEKEEIRPAVLAAQKEGITVEGPFPSDTVWPKVSHKNFDVGVAMYHDQGQIPVKMLGMEFFQNQLKTFRGINVTLGCPIIRTSVAHGTAFDIAGKRPASPASLIEATQLAAKMVHLMRMRHE
ncbi:MAG: 4-hydroxythreonine-4-phosphate dehydrogenase PdxA [Elusimicrobia bacterium]|nr:4-hydroxythreonine-4-phosphate dehydrogenase PdxA [Candidatus Obscuribacterium magneticum]